MRAAIALAVLLAPTPPLSAQEGPGPVMVTLADGSSFPLRPWSLSYEFSSWTKSTSPAFADVRRVDGLQLWAGKKVHPVAGSTIEIQYDTVERERDVDGDMQLVKLPLARLLVLKGPDGKKSEIRPEPPYRDFLLPGSDKSLLVQARSIDLRGQTLTGTKREFCIVSFTSLVECVSEQGQQIVKLEFPK
jgi:hypothetical protein